MKKVFWMIGLLTVILTQVPAKENWNDGLMKIDKDKISIESSSQWIFMAPDENDRLSEFTGNQTISRTASGDWLFRVELPYAKVKARLSPEFLYISEEQTITNSQWVKKWKIDRVYSRLEKGKLLTETFLQGKRTDSQKVKFNNDTSTGTAFECQIYALAASGDFKTRNLINILGGRTTKGKVDFIHTDDPFSQLAHEYEIPVAMKKSLKQGNYILADFQLTGVYGTVYPYHFYFLFQQSKSLTYVAQWGGKPEQANYNWRIDHE